MARVKLSCSGTCDTDLPVAPLGLDIKWFQRAAERKALSLQAWDPLDVEIEAGPRVRLHGGVARRAQELGVSVEVSLTHSRGMAGAVAILSP